jgi:hypothetical protein
MHENIDRIAVYLLLACVSDLRATPFVSDKLRLLAAAHATRTLLPKTAAACRERILQHNPSHAVGKLATMEQALRDSDFQTLLKRVEQQYPTEKAEQLLEQLEVYPQKLRRGNYTNKMWLASLLQIENEKLDDCLE